MALRVPSGIFESPTVGADTAGRGITGLGVASTGASVGEIVGGIVGEGASTVGFEAAGSTGSGVLVSWPHAMDAVVTMNKRTPIHLSGKCLP
jgi:hypothetical protein